jgi:hypothetical protein
MLPNTRSSNPSDASLAREPALHQPRPAVAVGTRWLAALLCAGLLWLAFQGTAQARPNPMLPSAELRGEGLLRFFGLQVYRARLWTDPGFEAANFAAAPLALELEYLRDFKASAIADRSIQEMRRAATLATDKANRWEEQLAQLLPDVKAGDRIMGVHQPGTGALFFHNEKPIGGIADEEFSRLFFGIWLGPATSEPGLRDALVNAPRR